MIILKKFFSKKQVEGNVRQFCSANSFLQNAMSSGMSENSAVSILTIMYMAALLRIGVTPLMELRRVKAVSDAAESFDLMFSK